MRDGLKGYDYRLRQGNYKIDGEKP
jgi:hypothetical protein